MLTETRFIISPSTLAAHARWTGKRPTPEMRRIMDSVARAEATGLSYTRDVLAFVINDMREELAGQDLKEHGQGVEGGVIGMETYYARNALHQEQENTRNRLAMERLKLTAGDFIGTLTVNRKRTTSVTIERVGEYSCNVVGKRGRYTVRGSILAAELERMIAEAKKPHNFSPITDNA